MLRFGSVFSGVGLLDLGLSYAGIGHEWFCESDPRRREILAKRWPGVPVHEDIRQIGGRLPPLTKEQFDHAAHLYATGMSLEAVAERFPVTRQGLWERMKRAGIEMRPRQRYGDDNHFHRGGAIGVDWAHNKVEKAVASGRLVRPKVCSQCGGAGVPYADGRAAIQAHHDDYNEPLDVRWLCQPCHHEWHKYNTAVSLRDEPKGGDAYGTLIDVPAVDGIVGGFPLDRARGSRQQASGQDSTTPRPFCGERWPESWARYDLATSSWRMSPTSSPSRRDWSGKKSSRPWPRSGLMLSGTVFQLRPSAPLTAVTGFSPLLPTPQGGDGIRGPNGQHWAELSPTVMNLLPTPTAGEAKQSRNKTSGRREDSAHHSGTTLTDVAYEWSGATTSPPFAGGKPFKGLRLSPWFVEWMIGAPRGWSDPGCPLSAMEFKYRLAASSASTSYILSSNGSNDRRREHMPELDLNLARAIAAKAVELEIMDKNEFANSTDEMFLESAKVLIDSVTQASARDTVNPAVLELMHVAQIPALSDGTREAYELRFGTASAETNGSAQLPPAPSEAQGPPIKEQASPGPVGSPEPAREAAPAEEIDISLIFPGYDDAKVADIKKAILASAASGDLTPEEWEQIKAYEASHEERKTILSLEPAFKAPEPEPAPVAEPAQPSLQDTVIIRPMAEQPTGGAEGVETFYNGETISRAQQEGLPLPQRVEFDQAPVVPIDIVDLSDKDLSALGARLHSCFAYGQLLLSKEENRRDAAEHLEREAERDAFVKAYELHKQSIPEEKRTQPTALEAARKHAEKDAETSENVRQWRNKRVRHAADARELKALTNGWDKGVWRIDKELDRRARLATTGRAA